MCRRRLRGESGGMQHWIHEVSRAVTGEGTSGAVRPMRPWRQPEDQDSCVRITEPWHWLGPIYLVDISPALLASDLLAIFNQPRTQRACGDLVVKDGEPLCSHCFRFYPRQSQKLSTAEVAEKVR